MDFTQKGRPLLEAAVLLVVAEYSQALAGEKAIENGNLEEQKPFRFTANSNFDFVCDTITPVSDPSESPFVFTGKIERVLLDISDIEFNELVGAAEIPMTVQ